MSIRVSTEENMDESIDSVREIPLRQWSHAVFIFQNNTIGPYSISLYLDGVQDQIAKFRSRVLSNGADLHIGKDPWSLGPQSLVGDVAIFDRALSSAEITKLAQNQKYARNPLPPSTSLDAHIASSRTAMIAQESEVLVDEATNVLAACGDTSEALQLLETAGEMGNARALFTAASVLLHGAAAHADEGAECGELSMAALLSNRKRVYAGTSSASTVSTVDEARSMLESAAKMGSGDAMWMLSVMHSSGLGVGGATESLQVGSGVI